MTEFEGIPAPLSRALVARGYTALTPIQEAILEPDLEMRDLLVSAQTGSGKTVAFGFALAPTLLGEEESFSRAGAPLALVVAPTRELALQVERELQWLFAETGARIGSCVGGMDMRTQRRMLDKGAHIIVGTPGRLRDHIERGSLDMSELRAAVLDEADEMLDLGFREDLEFILGAAPEDRRTLMFSATVPKQIAQLAQTYQNNARRISTTAEQKQHVDIEYRALVTTDKDRENAIINVLRYYDAPTAIVFCATRAAVTHLTARFNNRGFTVVALSGELSQTERSHALQALRDGRAQVCIATDVAARGIDLPGLELVVHADLPQNKEALLHRSGRTGRAGQKGVSAIIVPVRARKKAERLLQFAKINASWANPPTAAEVSARDDERLIADMAAAASSELELTTLTKELLERFSPEQIATAYVQLHQSRRSAPEELQTLDLGAAPEQRKAREGFAKSTWIRLSIGRDQRAEPRWILPMLCRAGDITKDDIGAIRMQQNETSVELEHSIAEKFFGSLGPKAELEDGIKVTEMDGPPAGQSSFKPRDGAPKERYKKPFGKPRGDKTNEERVKPGKFTKPGKPEKAERAPRPAYADKPRAKPAKQWESKFGGAADAVPRRPGSEASNRAEPAENAPRKARHVSKTPGAKYSGKPGVKSDAKSGGYGDKPAGKPFTKSGPKPAGNAGGTPPGKPKGKGSAYSDPSKSFKAPKSKARAGGSKPKSKIKPRD